MEQSLAFIEESGGTKKNLLTGMTLLTSVIHCFLGCVGIPINGFIVYAIVRVEELRNQTRYILLLGMLVGNILIFVILFDEVAYFVSPSENLCKFYRALLGLPYLIFSVNYLLVLIDNYIAISRPVWHLTRCTIRNVIPCQIGSNLLVCLIAKFFYFIGLITLSCEPTLKSRVLGVSTLTILITSCVILKIIIFIKTKKIISPNTNNLQNHNDDDDEADNIEIGETLNSAAPDAIILALAPPPPPPINNELRVHTTEDTISKQEKKAMRALMFSVISLLVIYIPRLLLALSEFICTKIHGNNNEKCNFLDARPFMAEFTALHGIVQPISFLCLCDQFWAAWNNRRQ